MSEMVWHHLKRHLEHYGAQYFGVMLLPMETRINLAKIFEQKPTPLFNSFIRIGKNIDNGPVILINPGEKISLTDYRLKHINIEHNILCNISENKNQLSENLTIVELNLNITRNARENTKTKIGIYFLVSF